MNVYEKEFRKTTEGMTGEQVVNYILEQNIISPIRFQGMLVNAWIDEKLKNPETKAITKSYYRTIDGVRNTRQGTLVRHKGLVDYMWEAAEYFGITFECVRKYRYYIYK